MMDEIKLDPVTFEVLRHRLWAINDEAGITIKLVSGSPIVTEGYDFNTGILTSRGEMVIMGVYVGSHACVMDEIIRHIQEDYQDNPGINEGDMFLCNDPYYGALHQPDVTIVAPVHWHGKLVAWTGCTAHQVDVGGPVAGGWSVGARSIFQEATPIPPIKIVEAGVIRKDLEKEYLRKSRLPGLVALDFRAQIAANNVSGKRLQELIKIYGSETVLQAMEAIISYVESRLKSRLRELPDGIWRHTSFIEHDGVDNKVYACKLAMTKKGDTLVTDFTDSSRQADGFINGCLGGLRGAVMSYILPMLCYDMPWSPAGVGRALSLRTKKGTIVDAEWPAAVSMASLASLWAARVAVNVCVGKMLAASPEYRDHAMSTWQGSLSGITFSGQDQRGKPTVGTLTVHMGGAGARTYKDGIDSSSYLSSLATAMPNVENTEFTYPLMYIYRNHLSDTGGAGKFRGGASGFYAIKPYNTTSPLGIVIFTHGVEQPPSSGICGAYPGSTSQPTIKRNSNIEDLFQRGYTPANLEEISGILEVLPAKATSQLSGKDVMEYILPGGGGFGDPLDREPDLVLNDVTNGLVSRYMAKKSYGVVIDKNGRLNLKGTQIQRKRIREQRASYGKIMLEFSSPDGNVKSIKPVSEYLELVKKGGQVCIRCRKCHTIISPAEENYKLYLAAAEYPTTRAGVHVASHIHSNRFVFREFYCPGCWTMLETETNLKGEQYIWDVDLS